MIDSDFDYDIWHARYCEVTAKFADNPNAELTPGEAKTVAWRWIGDFTGDAPWEGWDDDSSGRPTLHAFATDDPETDPINADMLLKEAQSLRDGMPDDLARYCDDCDVSPGAVTAWADALVRYMRAQQSVR
jgi:hypothetical protein